MKTQRPGPRTADDPRDDSDSDTPDRLRSDDDRITRVDESSEELREDDEQRFAETGDIEHD
jgi:hypothetical protein